MQLQCQGGSEVLTPVRLQLWTPSAPSAETQQPASPGRSAVCLWQRVQERKWDDREPRCCCFLSHHAWQLNALETLSEAPELRALCSKTASVYLGWKLTFSLALTSRTLKIPSDSSQHIPIFWGNTYQLTGRSCSFVTSERESSLIVHEWLRIRSLIT